MNGKSRSWLPKLGLGLVFTALIAAAAAAGYLGWMLWGSRPTLTGPVTLPGLTAAVQVERDANGVPTLTAANRVDLARALGFLHAQERFFQMDLLRRAGAGELSALVGAAALPVDRSRRLHRFRARATAALATQSPEEQALLGAYCDGVNAGLAALKSAPWEYALLRVTPTPWTTVDTALVVYAMYFDLEDSDADAQATAAREQRVLGPELAAFLYPRGGPTDAALDGSLLPEPAIPSAPAPHSDASAVALAADTAAPAPVKGSNNFVVAGALSDTGAAIVENDMHLDLRVPNIWYRARMRTGDGLDLVGVTLPGTPSLVVGSNTHIAWGFTDSYIETGDAVIVDTPAGDTTHYTTAEGLLPFTTHLETICVAHGSCEELTVRDTIWGPLVGADQAGHLLAWRWIAHDPGAVALKAFMGLETARSVAEALHVAHDAGLPDENLVVGDRDGHIGWTIIGRVPRRLNLNDQLPHSWADGSRGWTGYLSDAEIPQILDPPDGRLWSANARTLGGSAGLLLGDGFYDAPFRARAIHDDLFARNRFAEADLLAIATDDRAHALDPWQTLLRAAIAAHTERAADTHDGIAATPGTDGASPRDANTSTNTNTSASTSTSTNTSTSTSTNTSTSTGTSTGTNASTNIQASTAANVAALAPYVDAWGGKAEPDSVGYRLVREFRSAMIRRIYHGLAGALADADGDLKLARQPDDPSLRLLAARPAWLVPKPFPSWDALTDSALAAVADAAAGANGGVKGFTWGARNHTAIAHPLAAAVPLLGRLTDMPDVPVAGDSLVPRVATPGFGASERIVVSPGHEDRAIVDMPAGQSDNPLMPYYGAGEAAWVSGAATPLLPGATAWTLSLEPLR